MPATEYPIGEFYSYYPAWNNSGATPTNQPGSSEFYGSDDIVISGVSGRFPEAENIEEFSKYLYGGFNAEFEKKEYQSKPSTDFTHFDYKFFGFTEKQAELMDPKLRWLFETVYEAIFDSGFNPDEIRATKTGVFIGTTSFENQQFNAGGDGYMKYSSEISSYFGFTGPFFTYDTTQSSGLIALEKAIYAVRNGLCEQAIVGGVNFNSGSDYPYYGTVGVVFVQKSNVSRRFYAKVLNAKAVVTPSTGEKDVFFTSENGDAFVKLLREVFSEANIDPNFVTYYETHGYDKKFFESNEYKLIADIFGKNRNLPLFVGSTKSTYGYEHGMISLVKVLIAAQKG